MGTIYTEEQRERLQRHIVDLVRKNGRMTMPQLASATYASHDSIRRYLKMLVSRAKCMLSAEKGYSFQREFTVNGWQVRQEKQGLSANQHKNRVRQEHNPTTGTRT